MIFKPFTNDITEITSFQQAPHGKLRRNHGVKNTECTAAYLKPGIIPGWGIQENTPTLYILLEIYLVGVYDV